MKVPADQFEATVSFYADTLALTRVESLEPEYVFEFGGKRLWIDRMPDLKRVETWFEIIVDDTAQAAEYLERAGATRCDHVEPLPESIDGFWISNPAGVVHLIYDPSA